MMKYRLHKLLTLVLVATLLCALLPIGAMATDAQPADLMRLVGTSRSEVHYKVTDGSEVAALAFRFRVDATGLTYGAGRKTIYDNAKVSFDNGTYRMVRMGAVMTSKAETGQNPNAFKHGGVSVTNIDAVYLFAAGRNYGEFIARIMNIPADHLDTIVYARPYFVYKNASGEEIVEYGNTMTANASGKKIRYAVNTGVLGWTAGTLSTVDGTERDSTTEVRTDYINSTDLLICLPEQAKGNPSAYVRAYYYSADGYLSHVDVKDNWTVLSDLGIPADAVGVRLTAYAADGSAVTDAEALGTSIAVTGNKKQDTVPLAFQMGGLSMEDGSETVDAAYTRTGYLSVQDVLVKPEGRITFIPFFYDNHKQLISCGSFFMTYAKKVLDLAPESAAYVRFLLVDTALAPEDGEDRNSTAIDTVVPFGMAQFFAYRAGSDAYGTFEDEAEAEETEPTEPTEPSTSTVPSDPSGPSTSTSSTSKPTTTKPTTKPTEPEEPLVLTADKPENQGVQNALWNMKQLVNITYTPIRTVPQKVKDLPANVTKKGIPYSSTRIEQAYVPNNVSFHTFMTALQNPNSYLYTVDLGEDYGNINGDTYYGTVCSTTCAYALGIIPNYTTYQWTEIPGMTLLEQQDVQYLKLGDTIVGQGHVVMITGITRDQHGNIVKVQISESGATFAVSQTCTITALEDRFPAHLYEYCRYTKLADVTYTASEYVAVGDEKPQTVTYNTNLMPRKGDKANWRTDETVVLDILKKGTYTHLEILRDNESIEVLPLSSAVYRLTDNKFKVPGNYRARLIKEGSTSRSKSCYWIVTDARSEAELYQGTRQVKISFSASNAEPLYIQWINGTSNATIHITLLTDDQKEAGYGIFKPARAYLKARVAFQTPYGIIHAELPAEGITVQ